VEPIGGGLQAVVLLDQSKFKDEHKSFEEFEKKAITGRKLVRATEKVEIAALVAYTPKVEEAQADILSFINEAVALTNQTYVNSQINIELKLVDTVRVDYTEGDNHERDLEELRKMDVIKMHRDEAKADVCVLLVNNAQGCGLAAAILATEDTAFVVVHYDCAIKNLSFTHEIGHLQGARHNYEVDSNLDPTYPYNHGYLSQTGNWRTIMAYPDETHPNRVPYWSSPDVTSEGEAMGSADKHNNARMLNESALTVSEFRK
jgi:hypothetical protein